MVGKLFRLAPSAIVVASAAALFTATTAVAAPEDPIVDTTATISSTTLTEELGEGDVFTTHLSLLDNLTGYVSEGAGQCSIVTKSDTGSLAQCVMILRLEKGEVHISGLLSDAKSAPQAGAVIGGTGKYRDISGEAEITMTNDTTITVKVAGAAEPGEEPSEEPTEEPVTQQQPVTQEPVTEEPVAVTPDVDQPEVEEPDTVIVGPLAG